MYPLPIFGSAVLCESTAPFVVGTLPVTTCVGNSSKTSKGRKKASIKDVGGLIPLPLPSSPTLVGLSGK